MGHLALTSVEHTLDHSPVAAPAQSSEPLALRVRLDSDGQLLLVSELWREGFVRLGGSELVEGARVHATFVLSRYLSLTVTAVAGQVAVRASGDQAQAFQFVPEDPDVIDVLMTSAIPDSVVH